MLEVTLIVIFLVLSAASYGWHQLWLNRQNPMRFSRIAEIMAAMEDPEKARNFGGNFVEALHRERRKIVMPRVLVSMAVMAVALYALYFFIR